MNKAEEPAEPTEAELRWARDNEEVTFLPSSLVAWDGDPETPGVEWYAPKGWEPPALTDGDGKPVPFTDGDGNAVVIAGHCFRTTRIQAEALVKARAGTIGA